MTTETPEPKDRPSRAASAAAIRAAGEIAAKIPVLMIYRQALAESFADTIERHTHIRDCLAACEQARYALRASHGYTEAAEKQREAALATLEMVLRATE